MSEATSDGAVILVRLAADNGGDGTPDRRPTYTAWALGGGRIGGGMTPLRQRPACDIVPGRGYGLAVLLEGEWKLWDAGEVPAVDDEGGEIVVHLTALPHNFDDMQALAERGA